MKKLTRAARSICPAGAAGGFTPPPVLAGVAATGLEAVGTGGFPGALGVGLAPTGGGFAPTGGLAATTGGLGLAATGGGALPAIELDGRELAGESSGVELVPVTVFFQGVAEPLAGAIPGKTATGLALALAATE